MLDTNVVIDIQRNERQAMQKLAEFREHTLAISFLVYIEVMAGAQLRQKADTEKFLKWFVILPFDAKAQAVGKKFGRQHFVGRENKPMYLLIAAHAKSENVTVVTNNAKDFVFKGLKVYHYQK